MKRHFKVLIGLRSFWFHFLAKEDVLMKKMVFLLFLVICIGVTFTDTLLIETIFDIGFVVILFDLCGNCA